MASSTGKLEASFYTSVMAETLSSSALLDGIRLLILSARRSAARGVNLLQVYTNYEIGRRIVEQEQRGADRAEYGKQVLKELAERFTAEFGSGFSRSNLEYMRRFYLAYPNQHEQISQTLSGKFSEPFSRFSISQTASGELGEAGQERRFTLSWSHYVFLLGLEDQQRSFYEIEASQQGWTLRELKRQRGHIVNLGSVAAEFPYPGGNVYGASKAFVQQFSLNLRADLVGTPIRVTDIEPGLCSGTEFSLVRFRGDETKAAEVYNGVHALSADDVAQAVYWSVTLPLHVNINLVQMMPVQQAFGPFLVHRHSSIPLLES